MGDMDIGAERRGKLRLSLLLKLIPRLTLGMDIMVDTMVILTTDMDIGAERRGKLRLSLLLLLKLIPRLTLGMDTMVDTMDILTTDMDIMDTPMDITIMARDLLKLKQSLKLRLKLNPTMVDTMDTPMVITGVESK